MHPLHHAWQSAYVGDCTHANVIAIKVHVKQMLSLGGMHRDSIKGLPHEYAAPLLSRATVWLCPQATLVIVVSASALMRVGFGSGAYISFTEAADRRTTVHEAGHCLHVEVLSYADKHGAMLDIRCLLSSNIWSTQPRKEPPCLHEPGRGNAQSLALYSPSVPCPSWPYWGRPADSSCPLHNHMVNSAPHATAVQLSTATDRGFVISSACMKDKQAQWVAPPSAAIASSCSSTA